MNQLDLSSFLRRSPSHVEMDLNVNNNVVTTIDNYFLNVRDPFIERAIQSNSLWFEGTQDPWEGLRLHGEDEKIWMGEKGKVEDEHKALLVEGKEANEDEEVEEE